jgi:hypothetical protein
MRGQKLLVTLAVLLVFALVLYSSWPSSVTQENFDRIQVGMTEDEVKAILGPPGDHRNAENEYDPSPLHQPAHVFGRGNPRASYTRFWRSDTADIALGFVYSKDGITPILNDGICCSMRRKSDNLFYNLLWRAERQLRHGMA